MLALGGQCAARRDLAKARDGSRLPIRPRSRYLFHVKQTKNIYALPPPTIGDLRRDGLVAITVVCLVGVGGCGRSERLLFDRLDLDDATPFPLIGRRRSLVCSVCGVRSVAISPDWTDHVAAGNGRRGRTA